MVSGSLRSPAHAPRRHAGGLWRPTLGLPPPRFPPGAAPPGAALDTACAGRRLFWLFVGGAGFLAGLRWATDAPHDQPEWVAVLAALVVAVLGALLAIWLQLAAIALGGFLAGVSATLWVGRLAHAADDRSLWIVAVGAGVVAALLLLWLLDWALVALSALTGAVLVAPVPGLSPALTGFLGVGLFLVGFAVQAVQVAAQAKVSRASTARRS